MHNLDSPNNQIWSNKDASGIRWLMPKFSESELLQGTFNLEQHLEDFILQNWDKTELGNTLELIHENGVLISKQFRTPIGIIDILARDKFTGSYVVIELKKSQASDDTIGQIMRYMGWVEDHLGDRNVRGLIISGVFDEKLHYAVRTTNRIEVYLYEMSFRLKNFSR